MLSTVSPSLSLTIAGPAAPPPGRGTEAIFVLDVPGVPAGGPVGGGIAANLPAPIGVPEIPGLSPLPAAPIGPGEIPGLIAKLPGLVATLPGTIDLPDGTATPPKTIDVPGIASKLPAGIDLPYVPVDRQPIAAGGVTLPEMPVDLPGKRLVAGPGGKAFEGKVPGRGPGVAPDLLPCPVAPEQGDIGDPVAELPRPIVATPRAPFLPEKEPVTLPGTGEKTTSTPPVLAAPLIPAAAVPIVPVVAAPLAPAAPGDLTPIVASPIAPADSEEVPPPPAPALSQPIVSTLPAPVRPGRPASQPTEPILTPQVRGGPEALDPEPADEAKPHRPTLVAEDVPIILVPQDAPSPLPAPALPPLAEEKPRPEEMPADGPDAPQPALQPVPPPTVAPMPAPVEAVPAPLSKQTDRPPLVEAATPRPVGVANLPESLAPPAQPTDGPITAAAPPVQGPATSSDAKPAANPVQAERIAQPLPPVTEGSASTAPAATTPTPTVQAMPATPGASVVVARPGLPPAVKARVARLEQPAGPLPGPLLARPAAPAVQASPVAAVAPAASVAAPAAPVAPAGPTATPPAPAAAAIPVAEAPATGQPVAERPVETPVRAAPVAAPVPAAAPPPEAAIRSVTAPAREVFAAAIERARRSPASGPAAAAPVEMLSPAAPAAVRPVASMQDMPLDMTAPRWTEDMVSRIERMLDRADASDGRIRLRPDALGNVDLTVRSDGGQVHVHFRAEVAETRQMLRDAAPRLADAAEARGLQLGDASVSGGSQHGQAQDQQRGRDARAASAPLPNHRAPERASDDPTPEQRLA